MSIMRIQQIIVANRHHRYEVVYCGRGTPLGNPFFDGDRASNIDRYKHHLWAHLSRYDRERCCVCAERCAIRAEMDRLLKIDALVLLCSCAPLPCHADVIRAALRWVATLEKVVL